jgi:hypothetical protein
VHTAKIEWQPSHDARQGRLLDTGALFSYVVHGHSRCYVERLVDCVAEQKHRMGDAQQHDCRGDDRDGAIERRRTRRWFWYPVRELHWDHPLSLSLRRTLMAHVQFGIAMLFAILP